jgi:hypothetical protein
VTDDKIGARIMSYILPYYETNASFWARAMNDDRERGIKLRTLSHGAKVNRIHALSSRKPFLPGDPVLYPSSNAKLVEMHSLGDLNGRKRGSHKMSALSGPDKRSIWDKGYPGAARLITPQGKGPRRVDRHKRNKIKGDLPVCVL